MLPGFLFFSLLIISTFTDIDHWIIPDRISLGGTAAGLILSAVWPLGLTPRSPLSVPISMLNLAPKLIPMSNSLIGAFVGFAMFWLTGFFGALVFRREAMGWGDIKLAAMFGAFVGPLNCFFIFVLACFIGSLAGILGMAIRSLRGEEAIHPAAASLVPDPIRLDRMIHEHALPPAEQLVVARALTSPGTVGAIRHHLPFGPWLSLAAVIVYLTWEPIHEWVFHRLLWTGW